MSKEKVMPAGLPFVAAGAVWFVLALVLPIYKLLPLLLCAAAAIAVFAVLTSKRKAQIAKLPPAPAVKVRAEEMAKKLDTYRDQLADQAERVSDPQTARTIRSLSTTLDLIADEVEKDPKDRNKVRKLANHYGGMLTELVDKYIQGKEVEVDAICDGKDVFIPGIMELVERTGVHSGDSISVYPSFSISDKVKGTILQYAKQLQLPYSSGSDNHDASNMCFEKLGGILLDHPLTSIQDYVSVVLEKRPMEIKSPSAEILPPWQKGLPIDLPVQIHGENGALLPGDVRKLLEEGSF